MRRLFFIMLGIALVVLFGAMYLQNGGVSRQASVNTNDYLDEALGDLAAADQ